MHASKNISTSGVHYTSVTEMVTYFTVSK